MTLSNSIRNLVRFPSLKARAANSRTSTPVALGFFTSLGSWGPLLAGYYQAIRAELPGERDFWRKQITSDLDVLEIGAGSGFISVELARAQPKSLTLVEPETENIDLLEVVLLEANLETIPKIIAGKFEVTNVPQQDLIVFPYDSLPMITDKQQRASLIRISANRLKPGGRFILHVSTPSWNERYIAASKEVSRTRYRLSSGVEVTSERFVKRISESEYIKFVSIETLDRSQKENYVALTSIVTQEEVLAAAEKAGLRLVNCYSDFFGGKNPIGDDLILTFERP